MADSSSLAGSPVVERRSTIAPLDPSGSAQDREEGSRFDLIPDTTWNLMHAAAAGDVKARSLFAERYEPAVRDCLIARWRDSRRADVDDAVQEVFLECLRDGGVLDRVRANEVERFRGFLRGVVEKVALRIEELRARDAGIGGGSTLARADPGASGAGLSVMLDRAWARGILKDAAERQTADAKSSGAAAERRVELLRLRFHEGLPIRAIAERWKEDPEKVHREYSRARDEFQEALRNVVAGRYPGSPEAVQRVSAEILNLIR
jgi:DNA-directed RNA polymerase specialized sigma24 family protein